MTESAIRTDFDEALDVHRNVLAQIAFDRTSASMTWRMRLTSSSARSELSSSGPLWPRRECARRGGADAVDVSERDIRVLVARKIDACDTSHDPNPVLSVSCQFSVTANPALSPDAACVSSSRNHPHYALRWMTLHLSQIFLTDALTFINRFSVLSCQFSAGNSVPTESFATLRMTSASLRMTTIEIICTCTRCAAIQVVRRKFDCDFVAGQDSYKVLPHLAGNVRQYLVFVFELTLNMALGRGSTTTAITSIASSLLIRS